MLDWQQKLYSKRLQNVHLVQMDMYQQNEYRHVSWYSLSENIIIALMVVDIMGRY